MYCWVAFVVLTTDFFGCVGPAERNQGKAPEDYRRKQMMKIVRRSLNRSKLHNLQKDKYIRRCMELTALLCSFCGGMQHRANLVDNSHDHV